MKGARSALFKMCGLFEEIEDLDEFDVFCRNVESAAFLLDSPKIPERVDRRTFRTNSYRGESKSCAGKAYIFTPLPRPNTSVLNIISWEIIIIVLQLHTHIAAITIISVSVTNICNHHHSFCAGIHFFCAGIHYFCAEMCEYIFLCMHTFFVHTCIYIYFFVQACA